MEQCLDKTALRGRGRLFVYAIAALCAALAASPAAATLYWSLGETYNAACVETQVDQFDNVEYLPCSPCDKLGAVIIDRASAHIVTHRLTLIDSAACTYETPIDEQFVPSCGIPYNARQEWRNSDGTLAALGQSSEIIILCPGATPIDNPSDPGQTSNSAPGGVEGVIDTLWDSMGILFGAKEMTPNSDGSIPNKARQWEARLLWAGDTFTELLDNPGIFIGSKFLPYLMDQFGWLLWILFLPFLAFEAAAILTAQRGNKHIVWFTITWAKFHLQAGKWIIENLFQIVTSAIMMLVPIAVLAFKFLWNMTIGGIIGGAWKVNQAAFKLGSDVRKSL